MAFTDDLAVVRGMLEEEGAPGAHAALAALDRIERQYEEQPRLAEAERVLRQIADLRGHDYPGEAPDMADAYLASREQED